MGKTVCEKTSLLPRSCVVSNHPAAVGVSLLTCGSPATGKGSLEGIAPSIGSVGDAYDCEHEQVAAAAV